MKESQVKNENLEEKEYKLLREFTSNRCLAKLSDKKKLNRSLVTCINEIANRDHDKSAYYHDMCERVASCASFFKARINAENHDDAQIKMISNFCKNRLCSVCAYQRTKKLQHQAYKIFTYLQSNDEYKDKYDYYLLTLTVVNCKADELSMTIDRMMKAFDKLINSKLKRKKSICGFYRALEITHNHNAYSKSYNTYHPHFHVILVVDKDFSFVENQREEKNYFLNLWRECMNDESITQVDFRKVSAHKATKKKLSNSTRNESLALLENTDGLINSICEVTKYTVKSKDYIINYDFDLSCEIVETLLKSLKNRKLVVWGGLLRKIHKKLNLDNSIDGDLLESEKDNNIVYDECIELSCFWHVGYNEYAVYKVERLTAEEQEKRDRKQHEVKALSSMAKKSRYNRNVLVYDSVSDAKSDFVFEVEDDDKELVEKYKHYGEKETVFEDNSCDQDQLVLGDCML